VRRAIKNSGEKDGNPWAKVRRDISDDTGFRQVQDFVRYEVRKPGGWQNGIFDIPGEKSDKPRRIPWKIFGKIFRRSRPNLRKIYAFKKEVQSPGE
jgi:hypothetical protein